MRKAIRRWKGALGWILLACMLVGCAAAIYVWQYAEDVYSAVYAFYIYPQEEAHWTAETVSRLAQDCQALTETDAFRQSVLSCTRSDGKSYVKVEAVPGTRMMQVKVWGPDAAVVSELANGVGRELCQRATQLLQIAGAAEAQRALRPDAPIAPNRVLFVLKAIAAAFAAASVLGCCFGGNREKLHFDDADAQPFCLGAVADARRDVKRFLHSAAKTHTNGMLLDHVSRLIRENVREIALMLRSQTAQEHGYSVVFASVKPDGESAAIAALTASELASQGFRVLLMEMDAEGAQLHRLLDVKPRVDWVDYLQAKASMQDAMVRTQLPQLCFMDMMHPECELADFAAKQTFLNLLQGAVHHFDFVLLHAASVTAGNDAAMLSLLTDGLVLTLRDGSATLEEVEGAARTLARLGKAANGVVFTGVSLERMLQDD